MKRSRARLVFPLWKLLPLFVIRKKHRYLYIFEKYLFQLVRNKFIRSTIFNQKKHHKTITCSICNFFLFFSLRHFIILEIFISNTCDEIVLWENQREHHGTITSTVCVFILECMFSSLLVRHTHTRLYYLLEIFIWNWMYICMYTWWDPRMGKSERTPWNYDVLGLYLFREKSFFIYSFET